MRKANGVIAMNEFKAHLAPAEAEKVEGLLGELRELAARAQGSEGGVSSDDVKTKIDEVQAASLGLFQKVRSRPI